MDLLDLLLMIVCAVAWYRIGDLEYRRGLPLCAVSLLVWIGTSYGLGWSVFLSIGAQVGIFVALTIYNVAFKK